MEILNYFEDVENYVTGVRKNELCKLSNGLSIIRTKDSLTGWNEIYELRYMTSSSSTLSEYISKATAIMLIEDFGLKEKEVDE